MTRLIRAAQAFFCAVAVLLCGVHPARSAVVGPYFTGNYRLVPLQADCRPARRLPGGKAARCPVIVNGHQYYALGQTYALHLADGTALTAPAGMTTDLASIPRGVWSILPPDGPWGPAAGIHDPCYRTKGTFVWVWPGRPNAAPFIGLRNHPPLTRAQCDEALRQAMVALQVPAWKRVVIYEAVRLGGGSGWGR